MTDQRYPHPSNSNSDSDSDGSPPPSTVNTQSERHPALYYDDGTVVLSGLNQDGERQHFRVHKSVLSRHSPVLADLFAMPPLLAPGSGSYSLNHSRAERKLQLAESYDGVVHVQMPDSVEELTSFLSMFYDPL